MPIYSIWKMLKKKYNITKQSKVLFPLVDNRSYIQVTECEDFLEIEILNDRYLVGYTNLSTMLYELLEDSIYKN